MSIDLEAESNQLYNEGFDDGYNGYDKNSNDPDYLQGYYDGLEEAEDITPEYNFYDEWDYED